MNPNDPNTFSTSNDIPEDRESSSNFSLRCPSTHATGSQTDLPMKHSRSFLTLLLSAALLCVLTPKAPILAASTATTASREYYELRTYTLKPEKLPLLDEYLEKAFIPALKRLGIGPVGAFSESISPEKTALTLLIVFQSADQPLTLAQRLTQDPAYLSAAAPYLNAVAADPVYERIESNILGAISGMPSFAAPDTSKPRLLNLRIYESHNERAALKKQEMFNTAEIAIFRKVGLTPVLFGESLTGSSRPNLTYMLVFNDEEARKTAWNTFRTNPDWLTIKANPEYADKEIVSKITNKILLPRPYSGL